MVEVGEPRRLASRIPTGSRLSANYTTARPAPRDCPRLSVSINESIGDFDQKSWDCCEYYSTRLIEPRMPALRKL